MQGGKIFAWTLFLFADQARKFAPGSVSPFVKMQGMEARLAGMIFNLPAFAKIHHLQPGYDTGNA